MSSWRRDGEPWTGGEDAALTKGVRRIIGRYAKFPKSLSARALGITQHAFIHEFCFVEMGRKPPSIQARWRMLRFCACRKK